MVARSVALRARSSREADCLAALGNSQGYMAGKRPPLVVAVVGSLEAAAVHFPVGVSSEEARVQVEGELGCLEAAVQVPVGDSLEEALVQAVRELGCLEAAAVQVPAGVSSEALVQVARAAGCLEAAVVQVPVGDSLEEAQVQAQREAEAVQVPVGVSSGEEVLRSGVVV